MATISVAVECDCKYWVTIDETDVPMHNGKGSVQNVPPGSHGFVWAVLGSPGDSFAAVLEDDDGRTVCTVADWTIPADDDGWTGDYAPFTV